MNDLEPDGPMTEDECCVAAALSTEMIESIDTALLSHAERRNRKVTMLVGLMMLDNTLRVPGLPDLYYAQRVKTLVEKGLLVAEGNLNYMGRSKVRLP